MMTLRSFIDATRLVLTGMVIAQAIPLLGSLLIARLYSPHEFGHFSAWLAVVMTAAIVVTGRLDMTLVVEQDGESRTFAMAATLATIFVVTLALFLLSLFVLWVAPEKDWSKPSFVMLFVLATLLAALVQTWQSWAAADGLYRELSKIRITQALGITGVQILFGISFPSALGLAAGHTLGLLVGVLGAMYLMPVTSRSFLPWLFFPQKLRNFWARHKRFPLLALPADFINIAAGQLPLLLIATRFGTESSGLYALAVRMLGAPISLLGTAILDVFKRGAAKSYRDYGSCREEYIRTFYILGALGMAFAVGAFFTAEKLFAIAFGDSWRHAGIVSVWLIPLFAMKFVASPLSYIFYIVGAQRVDLFWQCGLLCMTLFAFLVPHSFESSVKMFAAGYAFLYLIYLVLSYQHSKGKLA